MDAGDLWKALRERASEEGFDLVGAARAVRLQQEGEHLAGWLRNRFHASQEWMERTVEERTDPALLLPGCKTVITVAIAYWPAETDLDPGRSMVARYALGRDYHKVLGKKLESLSAWLEEEIGLPCRWYVDSGPVMERAWAVKGGLGWIGKNANLINRRYGSWILLGEILTVAELTENRETARDMCGTCNACMEACPTGAIVAPGQVDSRLCLSYWNIEHRGTIPKEICRRMSHRLFGCDICQEICPWNAKCEPTKAAEVFSLRRDLALIDPREIAFMNEPEFRKRYSGTPLMRARWDGMRRNACIVLGNTEKVTSMPLLEKLMKDNDPVIRSQADCMLAMIRGRSG